MRNRSLTLALLASLAAMPAFAQDESASPTAKRFSVTGGYALSEPKSDTGRIAGS
ncbi:OmpW family protein, partial [Klebsiella pneumoniae]|nr:OmpW family protein [Klebsiella pneumoniae]